jgi:hypothetical protein
VHFIFLASFVEDEDLAGFAGQSWPKKPHSTSPNIQETRQPTDPVYVYQEYEMHRKKTAP